MHTACSVAGTISAHLQMYSLGMLGSCLLKMTFSPISLHQLSAYSSDRIQASQASTHLSSCMRYKFLPWQVC